MNSKESFATNTNLNNSLNLVSSSQNMYQNSCGGYAGSAFGMKDSNSIKVCQY